MTGRDPLAELDEGVQADPFASGGGAAADEVFECETPSEEELGLPPTGTQFIGQIVGITNSISKTSGNPMFVWECRVVADMQGGTQFAGFEPKPIYTVKGAKAAWKMDAVCRAIGLQANGDGKYSFTRDDVIGRMFVMELDEDEYKGQVQRTVGEMSTHPAGAGHKEAVVDADMPF